MLITDPWKWAYSHVVTCMLNCLGKSILHLFKGYKKLTLACNLTRNICNCISLTNGRWQRIHMYINNFTFEFSSFLVTPGPVRYANMWFPCTAVVVCGTGAVSYQTSALEPIAVITSLIKTSTVFALDGEAPGRKKEFTKWIQYCLPGFIFPLGLAHRKFLCHQPATGNGCTLLNALAQVGTKSSASGCP